MEIILKKDVANLGYANDLIQVKDGYGRNYLIPKGYAVLATPSAKKVREEDLRQKAHKEERLRSEALALAESANGLSLRIGTKAAASGKIFGSVNAIQIAEALKEQHNFEVDRKKINVDGDTIKELGSYVAKIKFYKDIVAEVNFEVFAE